MILAVCGKGGVGKTTVSAVAAQALSEVPDSRILIVDADPAGGLGIALGIKPARTLNDVRKEIIEEIRAGKRDERDLSVSLDYLLAEALSEKGNLAFVSIGRPEDIGCYCRVNVILKDAVEGLAVHFDHTLIDAEAGIEQVNRKVISSVDYVLLLSDTSSKAIRVAETVDAVSVDMIDNARTGLLFNRVRNEAELDELRKNTQLNILGGIPEDETIRRFDGEELSFLGLPDCPARQAIRSALGKTGII